MHNSNRLTHWVSGVALAVACSTVVFFATRSSGRDKVASEHVSAGQQDEPPPPRVVVERQLVERDETAPSEKGETEKPLNAAELAPEPELTNEAAMAEHAVSVAAAFASDRPGGPETRQVETRFRGALFDRNLAGVRVDQFACRAQSCRLDASVANQVAEEGMLQRLAMEILDNGYSIVVPTRAGQPDGTIKTTAYLFAPGAQPPPPDVRELAQSE